MHFFSPANVMKLLEVVRGEKTAKDVLATVMQLGKKIKKTGVVSGVCDGFIGNRMIEQYSRQAGFLLEEGATPQQVDKAIEKFGMAMGPFRMGDLAGNDVGWYIRKRRYVEKPDMPLLARPPTCSASWAASARRPAPAGTTTSRASATRSRRGRHRDDREAPRGARHHAAQDQRRGDRPAPASTRSSTRARRSSTRASRCARRDIDMVYLTGYGFPLHRGGPMHYADKRGPLQRRRGDEALRRRTRTTTPTFWQPAPLLAKLAAEGKTVQRLITATPHGEEPIRSHHDQRRHRLHRPHPARQELEGRLQHDPRRDAGRPRRQGRGRARRHRRRRGRRRASWAAPRPRARPAATSRARSRCAPACRSPTAA